MDIIEYFASGQQEHWQSQMATADWSAAAFLLELLRDTPKREALLGTDPKLFLLTAGEPLVSFVTLTHQDCIRDETLYPWLGFLYTYPDYRGHRYSQQLITYAEQQAKSDGHNRVYLATDHVGLYEKYGFTYWETRTDAWNEEARIYYKELK